MPGMYGDDFDLVGTISGIVEKDKLITGRNITADHVPIGLASNGLHTNGYSLARHVLFNINGLSPCTEPEELDESIGFCPAASSYLLLESNKKNAGGKYFYCRDGAHNRRRPV